MTSSKCNGQLGPVHTTPGEFENKGFTLKTQQMFYFHVTPTDFKNTTPFIFGFVFEENSVKEIDYHDAIVS